MSKIKNCLLKNIAPPVGTMLALILCAFITYKGYYSGPYTARSLADIQPAAGQDTFKDDGNIFIEIDLEDVPEWAVEQE